MSASHSTIKAAAYYRMSTFRQEDSIDRQRSQVEPYAQQHGYTIVREYLDEGISGSEEGRRKAFMALLKDAQRGNFKAILVDEDDRFCRFDSIDYGYYVKPLRDKGILLVTVAKGPVDWNSFEGRITSAVGVEGKNQEQAALSRRVLSDMLQRAKHGDHLGGKPPYGLRLIREAVEVPGRGMRMRPVRYEADGLKAEVVKLIFRLCDEGRSLVQIRIALHDRGIPSPSGKEWWGRQAILEKLTNPKYTGASAWGFRGEGKRYRQHKGQMRECQPGEKRCVRNGRENWIVVPEKHEALVSQELFARVQARLRGGRKQKGKDPGSCGRFVLSKLLVCGHCGHYLSGATVRGKRIYMCAGYLNYGRDFCHKNTLQEAPLLRYLVEQLQRAFLNPTNLERLRQEVRQLEEAARSTDNLTRLEQDLAKREQDLATARRNILLLPAELVGGAASQLRQLEQERDQAQLALQQARQFSPVQTLEEQVREVEAALFSLHEALEQADDLLLRELLRQIISKIVVFFEHETKKNFTWSRFARAEVYRREDERLELLTRVGMSDEDCPGSRRGRSREV